MNYPLLYHQNAINSDTFNKLHFWKWTRNHHSGKALRSYCYATEEIQTPLLDVFLKEDFFFFSPYDLLHSQFLRLKVLTEQNKDCAYLAMKFEIADAKHSTLKTKLLGF